MIAFLFHGTHRLCDTQNGDGKRHYRGATESLGECDGEKGGRGEHKQTCDPVRNE